MYIELSIVQYMDYLYPEKKDPQGKSDLLNLYKTGDNFQKYL